MSPTLQDIADKAGVSRMTVSLALRESPKIRQETRERIQKLAKEMDYRPNPMVSAHMSYLRQIKKVKPHAALAFVTRFSLNEVSSRHSGIHRSYLGAKERASRLGFSLEYHNILDTASNRGRLNNIFKARGIQGLIFVNTNHFADEIGIKWDGFTCSANSFSHLPISVHSTRTDIYGMFQTILDEVYRLGYRRPGLAVRNVAEEIFENRRICSFMGLLQHMGLEDAPPPLLFDHSDDPEVESWIRQHRPDVIISDHRLFEKLGQKHPFPEELGFALLNFSRVEEIQDSRIAGFDHNNELIGATLVDLVVEQLNMNMRGCLKESKTVVITGSWKSGSTLRQQ